MLSLGPRYKSTEVMDKVFPKHSKKILDSYNLQQKEISRLDRDVARLERNIKGCEDWRTLVRDIIPQLKNMGVNDLLKIKNKPKNMIKAKGKKKRKKRHTKRHTKRRTKRRTKKHLKIKRKKHRVKTRRRRRR